MLILRNVKIQAQQNCLPKHLPHAKALHHKSFTSSENKEAKKLSESRTTLRNSSKTLQCCENNFPWHFWPEKSEIRSDAGPLLKNAWCILNGIVLPWCWSVLTAPNDVHSDKFSVLFWSFSQLLKVKNLSVVILLQTLQLKVKNLSVVILLQTLVLHLVHQLPLIEFVISWVTCALITEAECESPYH